MRKIKRSLTTGTGKTRKRYDTAGRQQRRHARQGLALNKRARVNLAQNMAELLRARHGDAAASDTAKKVITAATLMRLEDAWKIGSTDGEAAMLAGISLTALNEIKQGMPELAERAEALKLLPTHTARRTIVKNLKAPRWSAWYLERKAPGEFSSTQKMEHSGQMLFSHFAGKQGNYNKVIDDTGRIQDGDDDK